VFPRPRLTGVRTSVSINYYNYNLDDLEGEELGNSDIYAVVEIESKLAWTSRGQDVRYRSLPSDWTSPVNAAGIPNGALEDMYVYGINVVVTANGIVAAFNFQLFITTIVSGLVFLGVAKQVVDFVAMNGLGVKSKLFKQFIQEEVNLEEECARFSLTALMASEFFKKKDVDGSGQLDLSEIQDMLRETFNAKAEEGDKEEGVMELSENEIASLALYILRTCDEDRDGAAPGGQREGPRRPRQLVHLLARVHQHLLPLQRHRQGAQGDRRAHQPRRDGRGRGVQDRQVRPLLAHRHARQGDAGDGGLGCEASGLGLRR
jgi:hypothetical protein